RGAKVKAVLVSGNLAAPAILDEPGTLAFAGLDVILHPFPMVAGNQWSHIHAWNITRPDSDRFGLGIEFGHQLPSNATHGHYRRDRHAAFASRTVARPDQSVSCKFQIRIGQHDGVILRAAKRLHALTISGTGFVDVFSNRRRADERHRGNST